MDQHHAAYNKAVAEKLEETEEEEGSSTYWDLSQWKAFATSILSSDDPRIQGFLDDLEENDAGAKAALAAAIASVSVAGLIASPSRRRSFTARPHPIDE